MLQYNISMGANVSMLEMIFIFPDFDISQSFLLILIKKFPSKVWCDSAVPDLTQMSEVLVSPR